MKTKVVLENGKEEQLECEPIQGVDQRAWVFVAFTPYHDKDRGCDVYEYSITHRLTGKAIFMSEYGEHLQSVARSVWRRMNLVERQAFLTCNDGQAIVDVIRPEIVDYIKMLRKKMKV